MSDKTNDIANIDEFTKNFAQAKAHLTSLSADDHFSSLSADDVSTILWAIDDRMCEMKKAFDKIIQK